MNTNFWFIIDDVLLANSQVGELTVIPESSLLTVEVMSQPQPTNFYDLFADAPSDTIQTAYVDWDYSQLVPLREDLQLLEDQYDGDFIVAGCWDFTTGEPVGGVGSPWFLTPTELLDFMPNGVYEDRHVNFGQGTRKFV